MTIDTDEFIRVHEGMIHGALKQRGIKKCHPDYEDFAQEARIYLFQFLEKKNATGNFDIEQVKSYAYIMLIWRLRSKRKQDINRKKFEQLICLLETPLTETPSMEKEIQLSVDLQSVFPRLNKEEQALIYELLVHNLSVEQIAKKRGVHRTTIHRQRQNLQRKILFI